MSNEPKLNQLSLVKSTNQGLVIKSSSLVKRGLMQLLSQESRTVRFPKDRPLGELYVCDVNSNDLLDWEFFGDAKGDVTVPLSKNLRLDFSAKTLVESISSAELSQIRENIYKNGGTILDIVNHLFSIFIPLLNTLKPNDLYGLFLWNSITNEHLINLQGLTGLKQLFIDQNKGYLRKEFNLEAPSIGNGLVTFIKEHTQLRLLEIENSNISDIALINLNELKELRKLSITGCEKVSDKWLATLNNLRELNDLCIARTAITDNAMNYIVTLRSLKYLDISNTRITGLKHLQRLGSLLQLYVSNTEIYDDELKYLCGLINLELLDLSSTTITDAGLAYLSKLTNLKELYLSSTLITDAGLVYLQRLNNLKLLGLCDTDITNNGIRKLQQALPNCDIYLW